MRRTLAPTRDAVRRVVDGRIGLEGAKLFTPDVQLHFADAYDKLLRASDGLELSRDLVAGVRDYSQAKIANDQNEVMKRLTAVASILLVPTFIVGLYGQNFRHIPELHWGFGYWWSWGLDHRDDDLPGRLLPPQALALTTALACDADQRGRAAEASLVMPRGGHAGFAGVAV